jgi:radical SAM protein with 4Fe4S-binding SPASM domain
MKDCSGFPQLGYGEFSDWLHKKVGNHRIPISGSLEVTMRCNLRCQHCYIPIDQRTSQKESELNLAEIERILDEITEAGCFWLLLTGGEPLLRRDFLDIYAYARHKGLILTLFTNGTLLTPRIADYLAEWRPFNIEITLYGATQATYEQVTGIPGSYSRCRRGIDLLLERKLPLGLKTMVITPNQHELDKIKALADSLGVRFRFDAIVNPALDGSARPTLFRLQPAEIVALEESDPERAHLWQEEFQKKKVVPRSDQRMYLCGAGKQGFHIDAAGQLYPCMNDRQLPYDLRNGSFQEGWGQFIPKVISRQYSVNFPCLGCELRLTCAQCPAMAELEHGEIEKRVDFLCHIAKLRQKVFAVPK